MAPTLHSFNQIGDTKEPIDKIIADPVAFVEQLSHKPHPRIPLPPKIYGDSRLNSKGIDLTNYKLLADLDDQMREAEKTEHHCQPMVPGYKPSGNKKNVISPQEISKVIGTVIPATESICLMALENADQAYLAWDRLGAEVRADRLNQLADKLEEQAVSLIALLCDEAGKTIPDALAEVREAVDFCRYYAARARKDLTVVTLPGPTGELNQLFMHGRGTFFCISPWNFPLAIFVGQVVAALVSGNCVIAKPAEQTPLIAARAVSLMHEVGIPESVVQLLPGSGGVIGTYCVTDLRIKGVLFTGSTATAKIVQRNLASRDGEIIPLIAETGGQNAMIVDSSALPEQVVRDVVLSAFGSAGQRCSALRVLFLQEEVADKIIEMLIGAMAELDVGDPRELSTDVGPVIGDEALAGLQAHYRKMTETATLLCRVPMDSVTERGTFFAPCVFELESLAQLEREVFGPVLHIIRYKSSKLDQVIEDIKQTGYGLTFGVHSRVTETAEYLQENLPVGNIYVNRNMIGAVVGVQPFGGEGLSGTGPKAGGPHYLARLCVERTVSTDTTASGGNASLLSLE